MNTLHAADPQRNATVHASAGTGKTWLLVTRIVRLLLAGARPDSILAVTFTRKAAAEMQERISTRLHDLMCAAPGELESQLAAIGLTADAQNCARARQLYEELLINPYTLRTTTFHAFCQELLQRFPLETGVSPGFELKETTGLLEQQAWEALITQSAGNTGPMSAVLDQLAESCDGLSNTQTALRSFLSHRSDWWAWIQDEDEPLSYAREQLEQLLQIDIDTAPLDGFPDNIQRARLQQFAALLGRNTTKTNTANAGLLADCLASDMDAAGFFAAIKPVFLTAANEARKLKPSKAQAARLGEADEQLYITLHFEICDELLALLDRQARYRTFHMTIAWLTAGEQLLSHYQRIKQEQRLLDFADLEWKACELLNRSEHASWVQYKLDTRIDHLLVDEFQDTNPTQWHLLLPLLQELAAGSEERLRSVFLVGDTKQSIYRFRRANPALLGEASRWLAQNLQSEKYPLDASRRSAQAIIDCVNSVFGSEPLQQRIGSFNQHTTYLPDDVYGRVELLPLITTDADSDAEAVTTALRNPLQTPRPDVEDRRYAREGEMIADRIDRLVSNNTPVTRDTTTRACRYGDIIILLRQRTHAGAYEKALREKGIPYLSASKGTLLDNIEIRDIECLLSLLISPHDNLALAQVLRSPLFNLDSEALLPLATAASGSWYERLAVLAAAQQVPFTTIHDMLERWRQATGRIPVHDLLDRIYHDAEIMPRYEAAFPPALLPRVRASLTRLIELALEIDNGRYPSLPRFLDQLKRLRRSDQDQPDEHAPEEADNNRVRLMTIHGAKGLEAPVIFLADAAIAKKSGHAYQTLVDWPGDADRPAHFLLTGTSKKLDTVSRNLLDRQDRDGLREDANLLYVAMTRARQQLYISGCQPDRSSEPGWYQMISAALAEWEGTAAGGRIRESGKAATPETPGVTESHTLETDPRLTQTINAPGRQHQIAPSRVTAGTVVESGDVDGQERGIAIHLMLQALAAHSVPASTDLPASLASKFNRDAHDPEVNAWWLEAQTTAGHADFAFLFDPEQSDQSFSEVAVQYMDADTLVYGVIDRLVICGETAFVIDYKTHRSASVETVAALAENYREQLRLYSLGIKKLWPEKQIRPYLLFTHCNMLVAMDEQTFA
jgi:ATP-dependent helicase/nuclease subunit A